MICTEFLARYTEYRDGLIAAPRELRRFQRHLAQCAACRRHDAALRRGVEALHSWAPITPSAGFRGRLEARLARERMAGAAVPARAGLAVAMLVLVALSLLVWEIGRRPQVALAPVLPPAAFPKPVANAGLPFVSFQDPRASVVDGNPYPYGTALVQPAVTQVEPASAGR
ncbi:MAG TPA: zf-HC2 domain-containing protein [Gemmatimonadales bacterium]|jgi:predicted anti-sigma-YlaC factor YlaD|nr:zf-HC2 domain-containing protein [Gemmatimonadales bacterium]